MAGDHATGARHYRESLRLRRRHGLDRSEESLAGLVRNLAAKPQRSLNYWVQQLANYGVEADDLIAGDTFLKAGTRLAINAHLNRAAELYALAVITPLASASDVDQELVQAAWGTVWAAIELLVEHGDSRDSAATRLKRAVVLIAGPDSGIDGIDGIFDGVVTAEVAAGGSS